MSVRQLGAASSEMFHCVQLKSGDGEIKCQCLVFKVFLLFGRAWSPHLSLLFKLLFNLTYECVFPLICGLMLETCCSSTGKELFLVLCVCSRAESLLRWEWRAKGLPLLSWGKNHNQGLDFVLCVQEQQPTPCLKSTTSPFGDSLEFCPKHGANS